MTLPLYCCVCSDLGPCRIADDGPMCEPCFEEEVRRGDDPVIPEGINDARWDDLYPFQREGVDWLSEHDLAILADQMGLGKTIETLVAHPTGCGLVVVCPASLKGVWAKEAEVWRNDLEVTILSGRGSFRWPEKDELVITNYEILPPAGELEGSPPARMSLVADEAHYLKTARSQRTRKFRVLSRLVEGCKGRVWLLTGTPLLNRPQELWTILATIGMSKKVFESWGQFTRYFGYFDGQWGRVDARVPNLLREVMLARRRREVLPDLPLKTHRVVQVSYLPVAVRKVCDKVAEEMTKAGIDPVKVDLDDPDALARFQEASFSAHLSSARRLLATSKVTLAKELADQYEAQDEPLVVFSAHREPIEILSERDGWEKIYGSTPIDQRNQIVEDFQAGKIKGLAMTIQSGGLGFTLTKSATAIFIDLCWSPSVNAQGEDRLCRVGQTRGVQIIRLVADHSIDRAVMGLLARKQELIDNTIEAAVTAPGGDGVWRKRTDLNRKGRSIHFTKRRTYRNRRRTYA